MGQRLVGRGAHRAACRDDMTGEADCCVGFLVVELELGRVRCAQGGIKTSARAALRGFGADGTCSGCPAGGGGTDVCRQAGCQSESISKSQLMPRLLGRTCCREARTKKRCLAGRESSSAAAGHRGGSKSDWSSSGAASRKYPGT